MSSLDFSTTSEESRPTAGLDTPVVDAAIELNQVEVFDNPDCSGSPSFTNQNSISAQCSNITQPRALYIICDAGIISGSCSNQSDINREPIQPTIGCYLVASNTLENQNYYVQQNCSDGAWSPIPKSNDTNVADGSNSSNSGEFSLGLIIGISIGATILLVLCAIMSCLYYSRRKTRMEKHDPNERKLCIPVLDSPSSSTLANEPNLDKRLTQSNTKAVGPLQNLSQLADTSPYLSPISINVWQSDRVSSAILVDLFQDFLNASTHNLRIILKTNGIFTTRYGDKEVERTFQKGFMARQFGVEFLECIKDFSVSKVVNSAGGDELLDKILEFSDEWESITVSLQEILSTKWHIEASKLRVFCSRGVKFYQMLFATNAELVKTQSRDVDSLVDGLHRLGTQLVPEILAPKRKTVGLGLSL